jgi:hypothetical protein
MYQRVDPLSDGGTSRSTSSLRVLGGGNITLGCLTFHSWVFHRQRRLVVEHGAGVPPTTYGAAALHYEVLLLGACMVSGAAQTRHSGSGRVRPGQVRWELGVEGVPLLHAVMRLGSVLLTQSHVPQDYR